MTFILNDIYLVFNLIFYFRKMPKKRPFLDISNKSNFVEQNKNKSQKRHILDDSNKENVNIKKLKTNNSKDIELFEIFDNSFSSSNGEEKNDDIVIINDDKKENKHVSKPTPTTELIKKLKQEIISNREECINYNPVDLCPSYRHYETDNRANSLTIQENLANCSEDEDFLLNRFANEQDLILRGPIRGANKQIYNRNIAYEEDLKRLSDRIFPILEKKPDENKFDMSNFKPPKGILVQLMDHQCRSLEWLKWREENFPHGAILGSFFSNFSFDSDLSY
jgi:hypothetical protein